MNLIPYEHKYKEELLSVFNSNVPTYFDSSEEAPFLDFLEKNGQAYSICENEGQIIGAGGYLEMEPGEARICWLMVDVSLHAKGIGRFMMEAFEEKVRQKEKYNRITLKTTQFANKFYEKLGFATTQFERDFWVPGWHLYFMEKKV